MEDLKKENKKALVSILLIVISMAISLSFLLCDTDSAYAIAVIIVITFIITVIISAFGVISVVAGCVFLYKIAMLIIKKEKICFIGLIKESYMTILGMI